MTEKSVDSRKFAHLVPVRITLHGVDSSHVVVDAWEDTPIPFPVANLPEDVLKKFDEGYSFVVAEARVNLGADEPENVIGKIIKSLHVPTDEELGF